MSQYTAEAKLFKALMHPARLAILGILRNGDECVCHLEAALGYRQAYISQHLMILREAELVEDRRDGWNIFYRVIKPEIFQLIDTVSELVGKTARLSLQDTHNRVRVPHCPCPKCHPEGIDTGQCKE
jgi:DNA-binding transcriptional ArsR family regulator